MPLALQFADPEYGAVADIVDLDRYPIDASGSERWTTLIEAARADLAHDGCLMLRGFLTAEALEQARDEIAAVAPKAAVRDWSSSVYARTDAERDLPAGDPRTVILDNRLGHVTRDQICPDSVVARLYVSPAFKQFVAACVGSARVFEYADPLAGLIATIIPPGGNKAWHYDTNEYVVTLMTQQGDVGGEFDYYPNLRTAGDENLDGLAQVLSGIVPDGAAEIPMKTKALQPGDLQIFLGRYALHGVRAVEGQTERHVAVLSYANRPGVIGPVDRTRAVYGRVTEAHLIAQEFANVSFDGLIA